jgi:hypothetical protein
LRASFQGVIPLHLVKAGSHFMVRQSMQGWLIWSAMHCCKQFMITHCTESSKQMEHASDNPVILIQFSVAGSIPKFVWAHVPMAPGMFLLASFKSVESAVLVHAPIAAPPPPPVDPELPLEVLLEDVSPPPAPPLPLELELDVAELDDEDEPTCGSDSLPHAAKSTVALSKPSQDQEER